MKPVLWRSRKQRYFALGFNLVSLPPFLIPLVCFQTALYHTSVQMPSVVSCIWPYIIYVLFLLCFHLFPFSSTLVCWPPCCQIDSHLRAFALVPSDWKPLLTDASLFSSPFSSRVLINWHLSEGFPDQPAEDCSPQPLHSLLWPCFFIFFLQCLSPSADSCVLLGRKLMFVHGRIFKSWSVLGI